MDESIEERAKSFAVDNAEDLIAQTMEQYEKYVNPGFARLMRLMGTTIEAKTEGVYMYDVRGNRFIDFLSGHGVYNLGFCHPKVVQAVREQLDSVAQTSARLFMNKPMADLCEKLAKITPGDLTYSFICNSGTEAVEGAIKLARAATGKPQIVSTDNAFHGKSMGSLSVTGRPLYREAFLPLVPHVNHVPYGDADALRASITDETAAVILEPIQGEGGVICPCEGYLRDARAICDEKDVLLILDEVQTGMGRTGKMFACEHEDVTPDIMCLAKALGGGVMPIGAFVATPKAFAPFEEHPLLHTSTFGGNQLACVAANAAIDVMLEEDLPRQAAEKGEYFLQKLRMLKTEYPSVVADIRGKGLLIGIEFVDEGAVGNVIFELEREGFIVLYMLNNPKVIRLEPPLVIGYEELDLMSSVLYGTVQKISQLN